MPHRLAHAFEPGYINAWAVHNAGVSMPHRLAHAFERDKVVVGHYYGFTSQCRIGWVMRSNDSAFMLLPHPDN